MGSNKMFTEEQLAHLKSIEGPRDQSGLAQFSDRLQEDGHPLWPLFARAHSWHQRRTEENPHYHRGFSLNVGGVYSSPDTLIHKLYGPKRPYLTSEIELPSGDSVSLRSGHVYHGGKLSRGMVFRLTSPEGKEHTFTAPLRKEEAQEIERYAHQYDPEPYLAAKEYDHSFSVHEPEQMARPEETSPDAVGNALASAAQKAQQPYGAVYVSPSVREGSTFHHALSEFLKGPHRQLLTDGERMGGSSVPALGTWTDGAEESSVIETPPELTRRLGAVLALKYKQKGVALFHPGEGEGEQHVLEFHRPIPVDQLYKGLLNAGIEYSTFLPKESDPTQVEGLHVLATKGDGTSEKLKSLFQGISRHVVNPGTVEIPSAPTREEAARMFRTMLQAPDQ